MYGNGSSNYDKGSGMYGKGSANCGSDSASYKNGGLCMVKVPLRVMDKESPYVW